MRVVIDAFGGDNAPLEIVKGAALASNEFGCDFFCFCLLVLCGGRGGGCGFGRTMRHVGS